MSFSCKNSRFIVSVSDLKSPSLTGTCNASLLKPRPVET